MRNITRLLKATALVVGSYYAGNIAGVIVTMMWGWYSDGWASVAGICIAGVQGLMGVFIFERLIEHFDRDVNFRFRVGVVMSWAVLGVTLLVAALRIWMLGTDLDTALSLVASIVASAPWCYWTTKTVLESRRASLAMAAA